MNFITTGRQKSLQNVQEFLEATVRHIESAQLESAIAKESSNFFKGLQKSLKEKLPSLKSNIEGQSLNKERDTGFTQQVIRWATLYEVDRFQIMPWIKAYQEAVFKHPLYKDPERREETSTNMDIARQSYLESQKFVKAQKIAEEQGPTQEQIDRALKHTDRLPKGIIPQTMREKVSDAYSNAATSPLPGSFLPGNKTWGEPTEENIHAKYMAAKDGAAWIQHGITMLQKGYSVAEIMDGVTFTDAGMIRTPKAQPAYSISSAVNSPFRAAL